MGERSATTRRTYGQACPVAHALDLVGERWTLLVVRDLMFGPLRFTDLRDGLPGLAPNLLSDRLRFLVDRGIVEQVELPPPAARRVYALTPRGRELAPVVHALARFGVADWVDPDVEPPPERLLRGALLALMAPERLDEAGWSARLVLAGTSVRVDVAPAGGGVAPLARLHVASPDPDDSVDATAAASLGTLVALRRGEDTRADAEGQGRLAVEGDERVVDQLSRLLGWV